MHLDELHTICSKLRVGALSLKDHTQSVCEH
jgi:hypothetical protein